MSKLDRFFCSLSLVVSLVGCQAAEPSPMPSSPLPSSDAATPSVPSDGGVPSTETYTCCLNGAYYDCPDRPAFVQCAGANIEECFARCGEGDFACYEACSAQASAATPDPSACTRVASGDGACSTSPIEPGPTPGPSCAANAIGRACVRDDDCGWTNHCYDGQCYRNRRGSPCFTGEQCGSVSSCVEGCCN